MNKRSKSGGIHGITPRSVPEDSNVFGRTVLSERIESTRSGFRLRSPEGQIVSERSVESIQRIRLKLVNRIRELIGKANYTIDAEKIAQRMLEEGF